eukprot:3840671-Amphidinium_carterae.1
MYAQNDPSTESHNSEASGDGSVTVECVIAKTEHQDNPRSMRKMARNCPKPMARTHFVSL